MYGHIFAKYGYYILKTVARILVTDRRTDRQTIAIAIPPPNIVCGGGNYIPILVYKCDYIR